MNVQFKQAEHVFQSSHYLESYKAYKDLLKKFPECKRIKLRLVESLFCLEDKEKHILAFEYLSNVTLDRHEWAELKNYMPAEYADYFKESIKTS